MSKKIQVNFSDKQIEILDKFKGEMGETSSEVVRNIVISWISEKNIMSALIKQKISNNKL